MTDDTQVLAHPEVEAFLEEVRARLADLTPEQRDELLDGLAADLTEQVADGAPGVLDDPAGYAAELRAAAGLPERRRRLGWPQPQAGFERARRLWEQRVGGGPTAEFLEALRPFWWVARAWIAVTLVDRIAGPYESVSLLPSFDMPWLGAVVLAAAVVGSVLIGMNRVWPGSGADRALPARLVLLGLNIGALLVPLGFGISGPGYLSGSPAGEYAGYDRGYYDASRQTARGLVHDGDPVRNIFAYNRAGEPLSGIQLFDQDGRPLELEAWQAHEGRGQGRTVGCAWRNGATPQYHVFPLAERPQRQGSCATSESAGTVAPTHLPSPPLATVPPVVPPEGLPEPAEAVEVPPKQRRR